MEESYVRQQIRTINQDGSLSQQQKSMAIQQLMMSNYRNIEEKRKEEEAATLIKLTNDVTYYNQIDNVYGCIHYIKNCKIKAPCCNEYFTCRRCHDDNKVNDHKINRCMITEMVCFYCFTSQSISNECIHCKKQMANYYCNVCKFFDGDTNKKIWHCDKCNVCRGLGGNNHNVKHEHCDLCNTCMDVNHTYHSNINCNCSICNENLSNSIKTVISPEPCHHIIHADCFEEYIRKGNYKCPVCSKTYSLLDMTNYWHIIDNEIEEHPMPEEYQYDVEFLCNDCNIKDMGPFNIFGYKCKKCHGYNTNSC